jgi:hypothetical protein
VKEDGAMMMGMAMVTEATHGGDAPLGLLSRSTFKIDGEGDGSCGGSSCMAARLRYGAEMNELIVSP